MSQNTRKQNAAREALKYVEDNAVLGVGTGSTVNYFIEGLQEIRERIRGAVSSSRASTEKLMKMGIPVLVHESNAFPGMTVKMLAHHCDCVMLAVEDARKRISAETEFVVTGNPVRAEVLEYDRSRARRELGVVDRPLIVSFGGSLGARTINESMLDLLVRSANDGRYQHIHGYGRYGSFILDELKSRGVDLKSCPHLDIREYISDMPRVMAAADLVICRSGAMALSEIQALGKAAILIPSPNVAENHQYYNALAMVNRGAAQMIVEKDITPELLMKKVDRLAGNKKKLAKMSENARNMAILDSRERILKVVCDTLRKHGRL